MMKRLMVLSVAALGLAACGGNRNEAGTAAGDSAAAVAAPATGTGAATGAGTGMTDSMGMRDTLSPAADSAMVTPGAAGTGMGTPATGGTAPHGSGTSHP